MRFGILGAVFALLLVAPSRLAAQSSDCDYVTCALRVQFGTFGGQSLVLAESGARVRGVGFPVSNLDGVFEGAPEAQELARTYRSRTNTGSALILAGGISLVVWLFDNSDPIGEYDNTWLWVGLPLTLAGAVTSASGRDYLSRAVWEYNKRLAR